MSLIFFYNNDNLYEISGTEMQKLVENVLKACKEEVVNDTNIYTIISGKIKTFFESQTVFEHTAPKGQPKLSTIQN